MKTMVAGFGEEEEESLNWNFSNIVYAADVSILNVMCTNKMI